MATKKIFKAVATVTTLSVATRAISFVFKIYLSRTLGAEVMGLYQICLSVFFLFSALAAGGLSTVLSRRVAEVNTKKDNDRGITMLSTALAVGSGIALTLIALIFIFEPYMELLFSDDRAVPLFLVMCPALLSTTVYCLIRSWFCGNKQFTAFSTTEMLEEILRILFTLLLVSGVVTGISGSYGIALAFTISDIAVAIILIVLFFIKGGKFTKPSNYADLVKPAIPVTFMRVFSSLIITLVAVILPARLMASGYSMSEATASYGRITGMANPLLYAPNAIISSLAIVLIPEMSQNGINKNYTALNRHINTALKFTLIVCGVFMAFYCALGEELCTLLYNDSIAGEYLEVAAYCMVLVPLNMIVNSALNSIGLEKEAFLCFIFGSIFMLASIYFLPQFIGIYAVVVANASTLLVSLGIGLYFLHKHSGYDCAFLKQFIIIVVFNIPCCYLAHTSYELFARYIGSYALISSGALVAVMYFSLIWIFNLVDISGFINKSALKTKKLAVAK
ncbi:MAG: oligosaccharide flippase family protein [Bacillota bacterium]